MFFHTCRLLSLGLSFFLLFIAAAAAATWYVPDDFPSIQDAIDGSADGDIVIVRPGTYVENIDFNGRAIEVKSELGPDVTTIDGGNPASSCYRSVVIFRSGEGRDSIIRGFTLLNGTGTSNPFFPGEGGGIFCDNASPLIVENVIQGNTSRFGGGIFTTITSNPEIRNNVISGNDAEDNGYGDGGGIFCSDDALITGNTISNNVSARAGGIAIAGEGTITDNTISDNQGSGISCNSSAPLIKNNVITGNIGSEGGGIRCSYSGDAEITHNIISGNSAEWGGGISCFITSPEIFNNVIADNSAEKGGGGIYSTTFCSPVVSGNLVSGNTTLVTGAGILCSGNGSPVIKGNRVTSNAATWGGGLAFCSGSSARAFNNIVALNSASSDGGGIYSSKSSPQLSNNTVVDNAAAYQGGGVLCKNSSLVIANTILWDNMAPQGMEICIRGGGMIASVLDISYSDVEGGQAAVNVQSGNTLNWGGGMIDAPPLFAYQITSDLHLTFPSPCRDAGDNASAPINPPEDFEGDPRIADSFVDMGADELHPHLYCMDDARPGESIELRIVGRPGDSVLLGLGSGVRDTPLILLYGEFWLEQPIQRFELALIPSTGVLSAHGTVPGTWLPGEEHPFQAFTGGVLTNLMILQVEPLSP